MHKTLEIGHPQPQTPIQMDNKTADGLINNKILSKATKSIDMKSHWIRCGIFKSNSATFFFPYNNYYIN